MSETTDRPDRRPNGHSHVHGLSEAGSDTAPRDPEKAARFQRVAPRRVQAALDAIWRVGHLADARYDYSTDEAEQIVFAMTKAVSKVAEKLHLPPLEKKAFAFE
jgi:hypothetical protein